MVRCEVEEDDQSYDIRFDIPTRSGVRQQYLRKLTNSSVHELGTGLIEAVARDHLGKTVTRTAVEMLQDYYADEGCLKEVLKDIDQDFRDALLTALKSD